jgi:hypothetical protein
MSAKKIRLCGWIDKQLKADLLKHCHHNCPVSGKPLKRSQSQLLELFLAESVAHRKRATPGS